jgi:NAD(P)-dependent dehydrogenase (short-subunit alcohol dehydrogenase family)
MPSLLDTALDRSIVGGYTAVGYRLRRRGWDDGDLRRMDGELAVVTGATSGLGLAAAEGFARLGARVLLVVRDAGRGRQARERLLGRVGGGAAAAGAVDVARCDLSSLADVRRFAAELAARERRVGVLVHNAGALAPRRTLTGEGNELTLATNVLGPFLLTGLLHERTDRIINVSSGGMYTTKLDVDDLQSRRGDFSGAKAYANTKRAEVVLTELWAARLDPTRTVIHAMHPGWADTPGLAASLPRFHRLTKPILRNAAQGADTIIWLGAAATPAQTTGLFWHDRAPRPTSYVRWTRESPTDRARLWAACERLTGWPAAR